MTSSASRLAPLVPGAPLAPGAPPDRAPAPLPAFERFRAKRYYRSVDGLRGLSILAVIWHHVAGIPSPSGYVPVSLFFGISGFLITTLLIRDEEMHGRVELRRFYARRILRTWPLYYLVLAIYVALVWTIDRETAVGRTFFANLPYFLTYTTNWFVDTRQGRETIFYFAWSIATQEQFYLVWPAVVRFSRSWMVPVAFTVAALVVNQAVAVALLHGAAVPRALTGVALATVSVPICFGALAACLVHRRRGFAAFEALVGWRWAPLALLGGMLVAHVAGASAGPALFLAQLLIVLLVVACCIRPDHVLAPLLTAPALRWVGTVSYGIYLLHMLAVNAARHVVPDPARHPLLVFLVAAPLSIAAATLSFRTYESWFAKLKRRYVPNRPRVAADASSTFGASPLRVECITTPDAMERLAPEWRALFDAVGDALPFATYEWAAAWWTHLRRTRGPLRDRLQCFAIRDSRGALVGVAPMMHTDMLVAGVRLVRVLQPIGTDANLTEVRGMLVDATREGDALDALARFVAERGGQSWVQWCGIRRAGPAFARLTAVRSALVDKETPTFVLVLPGSWDEFKAGFPRNLKESLRKCYNSLSREGHDWRLRVVDAPGEVAGAVERLIVLHGARAARTDTVRHRDCFDDPDARRFLHEVTDALARRGMVRVFQLVIGGEVVATRLAFVFGDRMYLYYSGYDPAWGRFSVMTTTVAEALRWAIANGIASANLSTWPDESKLRWRPAQVDYLDARTVSDGPYAYLAYRAVHTPLRDNVKRFVRRG